MNENIVKLNYKDKEIYLVKTAHVSKNSINDVKECIGEVKPDAICIELDEDRYKKISDPEKWSDTDIVKVIKEKKVGFLLVNLILASFQRRMAINMDSNSGGEMLEGIKQAKELNINTVNQTNLYVELVLENELINKIPVDKLFMEANDISTRFKFEYKNDRLYIKLMTNGLDKHFVYYLTELLSKIKDMIV